MQTFLPHTDYVKSARLLDYRRLGKQRVEARQILVALREPWSVQEYRARKGKEPGNGWMRHPYTLRWKGYEPSLMWYFRCMVLEWVRRGYVNNMVVPTIDEIGTMVTPPWVNENLAREHRRLLYSKNPVFYSKWSNQ